jgi:hypothetical protein
MHQSTLTEDLLALEFWAAAAAFTIRCRYCAPGTAGFNRNVEKRWDA